MTVAFLFVATAASLLMSPRSHPRARIPMASANPELSKFLTDAEAFLEATGIGEDGEATEADRRGRPPKANKKAKRAPKASKVAKQRVGCYGCGADLQMDVLGAAGYVEPERYEVKAVHRQLKQLLCRRCRALSQGEILPAVVEGRLKAAVPTRPPELELPTPDDGDATDDDANVSSKSSTDAATDEALGMGIGVTTPEELRAELAPLRDQKVLAVLLVDVSDVTGTFLPRVRDLIGGNPIILVDLLPKGTSADEVLAWLYARLSPRLNVIDAHLISARDGDGVAQASQAILRERKGRDTFILGAANVGKSLFLGAFMESALGGRGKRLPISSATPGTTLRIIGIDCFDGGSMLFDTPGLHLPHRLSAQLLPAELRAILPRGRIKPYTPKIDVPLEGTSLFWGGLVRIDVLTAPIAARLSFVSAYTLRVSHWTDGIATAGAHYDAEAGRSLTPPLTPESAAQLGELEMRLRVEVDLNPMEQAADISISGLGWVSIGALASMRQTEPMKAVLEVWVPKGVQVSLRPPMPVAGLPNGVELPPGMLESGAGGFSDEYLKFGE